MSSKEPDNPITLQLRNGKTYLTCCQQSLHSKNLKYDLASQQRKPNATEQWPSRCLSLRTDPSHQTLHQKSNYMPFPNEIENSNVPINQINTHHNRSEIMIRSPETIVITTLLPNQKKEYARNLYRKTPSFILHYKKTLKN